jgi:CHAT domain-containing protein/Tfp pilus assembly protein PilF
MFVGFRFTLLILVLCIARNTLATNDPILLKAEQKLQEGDELLAHAKVEESVAFYSESLKLFEQLNDKPKLATNYYKMGRACNRLGRYDQAADLLAKAKKLHTELGDRSAIGYDLSELASVVYSKGNFKQAIELAQEALQIHREINDEHGISSSLFILGNILNQKGDSEGGLELAQQALMISKKLNDSSLTFLNLNLIGNSNIRLGNLDDAKSYLEQALEIAKQSPDKDKLGMANLNLGRVYWHRGNLQKALEHYDASLQIAESTASTKGITANLNNLALVYLSQGAYAEALRCHQRALSIREKAKDKAMIPSSLANIGEVYFEMGDLQRALEYLKKALALDLGIGEQHGIGTDYLGIGDIYEKYDQHQLAIENYRHAEKTFQDTKEKKGLAQASNRLGNVYASLGMNEKALDYQQQAMSVADEIGDQKVISEIHRSLGTIYYKLENYDQANKNALEAIRISKEIGLSETLSASLYLNGLINKSAGEIDSAVDSMKESIAVIESARANLRLPEDKETFLKNRLDVYADLTALLVKSGKNVEAFEYAERSRARSFLDLLAEAKIDPLSHLNAEFLERISDLYAKFAEAQKKIAKGNTSADLKRKLRDLDEEYLDLMRDIRQENPGYADLTTVEPLRLNEVYDQLDDQTVLLEYSLGKKESFVFTVTKNNLAVYSLANEKVISDSIRELNDVIAKPEQVYETTEGAHHKLLQTASRLYQLLIQPAISQLSGKQRLIIAPDGALNALPFEVLVTQKVNEKNIKFAQVPYLVKNFEINYLPSASILSAIRQRANKIENQSLQKNLIGFADAVYSNPKEVNANDNLGYFGMMNLSSLPGTRKELEAIAQLYPVGTVSTFFGMKASESAFKSSQISQFKKLHFALHGEINQDRPEFSSLVFSADKNGKEDGYLTLREILDLRLNADLVVLSACKTALGQQIRGEGIKSFARAFLYSGTPSVVVTLWNVSDQSTVEFMKSFYSNLEAKNMNKAAALKNARLKLIHSQFYNHPYYWAPFVLVGDI